MATRIGICVKRLVLKQICGSGRYGIHMSLYILSIMFITVHKGDRRAHRNVKAKQSKMCNGRRQVPLCPACANGK